MGGLVDVPDTRRRRFLARIAKLQVSFGEDLTTALQGRPPKSTCNSLIGSTERLGSGQVGPEANIGHAWRQVCTDSRDRAGLEEQQRPLGAYAVEASCLGLLPRTSKRQLNCLMELQEELGCMVQRSLDLFDQVLNRRTDAYGVYKERSN